MQPVDLVLTGFFLTEIMMPKSKQKAPSRAANEIRSIMLRYFYERNRNATSSMGKKGSAVKISDVKRQLKETLPHATGGPK